ncbi:MAG: HAMP domain-containing histidine kinase [Paenibacillus sp.]|uniref:ATP-binding protein n=1 Tax=Paenibacillus sp. TaxID=58172 RepID=UPI0025CF79B7|nr:ATP-binding protein [Paenibacillus sp.]MBR2563646.1 HAMP domain-containing histidine kinase [Paenibacillus sp.]
MVNKLNKLIKSVLPLVLIVLLLTILYVGVIQYMNYTYREQAIQSHKKELEQAVSVIRNRLDSQYELWQQTLIHLAQMGLTKTSNGTLKADPEIAELLPDTWAVLNKQGQTIASNKNHVSVPANLLNIASDQTYQWTEFYAEDDVPKQYLISPIPRESAKDMVAVLEIGPDQLSETIGSDLPYHISLYNYEYKVVASDLKGEIGHPVINEITKKMLDGDTGTEHADGKMTAYGFSDTKGGALYVSAWLAESDILREANRFKMWSSLSIVPVIFVFTLLAAWYRKMIIARETHHQRSRDVQHQASLLKRQDELHVPFLQEINEGIESMSDRLQALTGGEDIKLLGFYRDIADEWAQEEGLLMNPERAEKKAFFDELNEMFIQNRLEQEKEIDVVQHQLRTMGMKVTSHLQTGMNNELVDINILIQDTITWARAHMDLSDVEVYFVAEHIPAVLLHPMMFRKLIVGLLENAVKAMRKQNKAQESAGSSRKTIRSGRTTTMKIQIYTRLEPQGISVEMEDEGGGLDDKKRYQYFQENYSQSTQEHGLSLFRMDQYLKSINGKLKLRNTDVGLKATVRVPR